MNSTWTLERVVPGEVISVYPTVGVISVTDSAGNTYTLDPDTGAWEARNHAPAQNVHLTISYVGGPDKNNGVARIERFGPGVETLKVALRDIANRAGSPTMTYSPENERREQRESLDWIAQRAAKALKRV